MLCCSREIWTALLRKLPRDQENLCIHHGASLTVFGSSSIKVDSSFQGKFNVPSVILLLLLLAFAKPWYSWLASHEKVKRSVLELVPHKLWASAFHFAMLSDQVE